MKEQAKKINRLESQLRIKEDEIAEKNKDMMNKDKDHEILERELNEQLKHEKQKIEELKMALDQAGSATSKMKAKTSELEHQIQLLRMEKEGVDESSVKEYPREVVPTQQRDQQTGRKSQSAYRRRRKKG
ncbi:hypothetical protein FALCPG4_015427 [Fusarium falciforme]